MPMHSVYEFTCVCGRNFQTDEPHDLQCPGCGRGLVVEWRAAPVQGAVSSECQEVRP